MDEDLDGQRRVEGERGFGDGLGDGRRWRFRWFIIISVSIFGCCCCRFFSALDATSEKARLGRSDVQIVDDDGALDIRVDGRVEKEFGLELLRRCWPVEEKTGPEASQFVEATSKETWRLFCL